MDKTGRNGLRVGDINSEDFKEKYNQLKNKHFALLKDSKLIQDIDNLENEFLESIEYLKKFEHIDSEHFLNNASKMEKNSC